MSTMHLLKFYFGCVIAIFFTLFFTQCSIDRDYYTGDDIQLRYSLDTLTFDTVFTTIGSTTKFLKVYNDLNQRVNIDRIALSSTFSQFFRLNVDGVPIENEIEDVTILPNDSIYIFVETTIDPDQPNSISPFIIENWLTISIQNKEDQILLQAWGQNANYIPSNQANSSVAYYSCNFGEWIWDDPRPYVVYGSLIIDSCDLVLPPGTKVYFHGGIANNDFGIYNDGLLIIRSRAKMLSMGEVDNKVEIRTDRLEEQYLDDGGQWAGIILSAGSKNNEFNHTLIYNSIVGVRVDSSSQVEFNSCEIGHNSANNILAFHADVEATNCLFHNAGDHGLLFTQGGNYKLTYCTVFNESSQSHALFMNNFRCTDPLCVEEILVNDADGIFVNSIFSGYNEDEIWLQDILQDQNGVMYQFDNCLFAVEELLDVENFPTFFEQVESSFNEYFIDSLFIDYEAYDFHLDTFALVLDAARSISNVTEDIEGNMRGFTPDVGCYEFQD